MPGEIQLDLIALAATAQAAKAAYPGDPWFYQEKSDAYTHIVRVENPALHNSLIVAQMGQRTDGVAEAIARHMAATNPDVVLALIAENEALRNLTELVAKKLRSAELCNPRAVEFLLDEAREALANYLPKGWPLEVNQ